MDLQQITTFISAFFFLLFFIFQMKFYRETKRYTHLFRDFFRRKEDYETIQEWSGEESILQLKQVSAKGSDLHDLITEINHYVIKTKGTTDFSVIQNKVERKLNMRYDQSSAKLSFPTYLGLMGTFLGVFIGINAFTIGIGTDGITDEAIRNLLFGVLVSMSTSFVGLLFTTINTARSAEARKKIEEDKNEFFDFIQTELMPSLDVSLVLAITRLHKTVNNFEPAFNRVIDRFQNTFDRCTSAFGDNFEKNVKAVANAVDVMGKNMERINENIDLQERLILTLKSGELVRGMDKYVEAANHFVEITKSLNKFEEARRMMLAAAQEAINIQNQYSESLKIPREVAVRINQILDRIKSFEASVNQLGPQLDRRMILGNEVVQKIEEQIKGISYKGKIADKYLELADGKLEELFIAQTEAINQMNIRYKTAIEQHIENFEKMIESQTSELERRHKEFIRAVEEKISIDEVHQDFSNLKRLNEIFEQLKTLTKDTVKSEDLQKRLKKIEDELATLSTTLKKREEESGRRRGIFSFGN